MFDDNISLNKSDIEYEYDASNYGIAVSKVAFYKLSDHDKKRYAANDGKHSSG